jgi:biopolymer transport protein ExbB/TolQ
VVMVAGLVVAIIVMLIISRMARRAVEAVATPGQVGDIS